MTTESSFYATVPSNAVGDNRLNDFQVQLPHTKSLGGQWEVGLVEITYPHTWNNVESGHWGSISAKIQLEDSTREDLLMWHSVDIPSNYYSDPSEFAAILDLACYDLVKRHDRLDEKFIRFSCDPVLKRIGFNVTSKVREIWIPDRLFYMMGYETRKFEGKQFCTT